MHEALSNIQNELKTLISVLQDCIPSDEPFGIAHNNWSFPGLSKIELIEEVEFVINFIKDHETEDLGEFEQRIYDYERRLNHLHNQTVPNMWGNENYAVPAFMLTIQGLRKVLAAALATDSRADTMRRLRNLKAQVTRMEAQLNDLEPTVSSITTMAKRIVDAHDAAEQLPETLESLREARETISRISCEINTNRDKVGNSQKISDKIVGELRRIEVVAEDVLQRCETAYAAATSVGLAASFDERSKSLSYSMWFWVAGLAGALLVGGVLGTIQIRELLNVLNVNGTSESVVVMNAILSLFSVGAPIWFAWLSTKQIGQRFRLSEDYAYKASIARAYEGFRREAARIDKDMEAQLLTSALNHLDELPLRLVEHDSHGSPWHELASSEVVKSALKSVPGFAGQVKELASKAVGAVKRPKEESKPARSERREPDE